MINNHLPKKNTPNSINKNKEIAKRGGRIAKLTRDNLEKELKETVITKTNNLNYNI